jgi:hypothetical protein
MNMTDDAEPAVAVTSAEEGADVWDALRDPNVWSALAQLAAALGHPAAALRLPIYGAAFQVISKLVGPHPASHNRPEEYPP